MRESPETTQLPYSLTNPIKAVAVRLNLLGEHTKPLFLLTDGERRE